MISQQPTTDGRQEKHIALDEAIQSIDNVQRTAMALYRKITATRVLEEKSQQVKEAERTKPSLAEVLEHSPDAICSKCGDIVATLADIEAILF